MSHKMPARLQSLYDDVMPQIKAQLVIGSDQKYITEFVQQKYSISTWRIKEWIAKCEHDLAYPDEVDDDDEGED